MPQIKTADAFIFFLYAIVAGGVIGALYDIFRAIRNASKSKILCFILDVLFFILSGIIIFLFCLISDYGRIRGFLVSGIASGFFLYRLTLSFFVFKALLFFINIIKKTLSFLITPLKKMTVTVLSWVNQKIFSKIYKKLIKKVLKKCKGILYNKKYDRGKVMKTSGGKEKSEMDEIEKYFN